jgi:hypothetical protein
MAKLKTLARALRSPTGPEAFAVAVSAFRVIFRRPYPFHWADLDWIRDERFWRVMERYGERDGLNAHRRKLVFEFARQTTRRIGGHTAECGAFRGLGSHLICMALQDTGGDGRRHFIFDSFEGLSEPSDSDGAYWSKGDLVCDEGTIRANLAEFDFVTYLKGWIPERFAEVAERRFSLVHIDVDLAEPTKHSLEFFFPRLELGGVIIVDDYGFASCPGVTAIVDDFIARNPDASLVQSPVGGGIIQKHQLLLAIRDDRHLLGT